MCDAKHPWGLLLNVLFRKVLKTQRASLAYKSLYEPFIS
jgi:hypothetical protein